MTTQQTPAEKTADAILPRVAAERQKKLTPQQRSRLDQIAAEVIGAVGTASAALIILAATVGPAVAADRWTPAPERGAATTTISSCS